MNNQIYFSIVLLTAASVCLQKQLAPKPTGQYQLRAVLDFNQPNILQQSAPSWYDFNTNPVQDEYGLPIQQSSYFRTYELNNYQTLYCASSSRICFAAVEVYAGTIVQIISIKPGDFIPLEQ